MVEVKARYQVKDDDNNAVLDAEGAPIWKDCTIQYDFGDSLEDAVDKFGADVVFSNFVANSKVAVQGIMRSKMKAGLTEEAIQDFMSTYKIGMVVEKTQVNPLDAVKAAFATWSPEKQREYLKELGVAVD